MSINQIKKEVIKEIDRLRPEIINISRLIHSKPELAYNESFAADILTSFLRKNDFKVERGIGGLKTSFIASAKGRRKSPSIARIAEYDALPKIGHACGHNMIGAISTGAAIALKNVASSMAGKISVIGTPAEEGGGGKIKLIEKGVFKNIDMAMMAHPSNKTRVVGRMLAVVEMTFTFIGKSSHAAAFPYEGVNALDGVILTYNNINALRQQLKEDVRIHGIITEGGAAKATGCSLRIAIRETVYHPFKPNYVMADILRYNMKLAGLKEDSIGEKESMGSSDIGNLSQFVPTIHPEFAIGKRSVVNHSPEFAKVAVSKFGG